MSANNQKSLLAQVKRLRAAADVLEKLAMKSGAAKPTKAKRSKKMKAKAVAKTAPKKVIRKPRTIARFTAPTRAKAGHRNGALHI